MALLNWMKEEDRTHRYIYRQWIDAIGIGQTKPVHVYRLATVKSVEGRILKRAFSMSKLEQLVIEKGQFQQERSNTNANDVLQQEDLLALLREEESAEYKLVQTDSGDEDLERVMDCSYLLALLRHVQMPFF
ncbi:hypothetical protein DM860_009739 [Cuscuta australis]|uniref:Uncharacterized protein n=2 Tax=Cuscuta sect. Cleistogrammica TaxID=1824901 RepID=A0A328DAX1_9ASTE|nr:hypothetical protein DM860_009739 [Cuscuta australis]